MALTQVQGGLIESGAALNNIGAGNITPAYLSTQSQYTGFKNRIINGDMRVDQRNNGASVTPTDGTYTLDRWMGRVSQTSKISIQRNAGSVTPPVGFTNYLGVTSLSSYSVGSSDFFALEHRIEGFNTADLGWGTANASTVTISFWVRSSLTGTFGGTLNNNDFNRSYPFTYTISSANTWEKKSVTIVGDTTGTWATNNAIGIALWFGLGVGTTYSGTPNLWTSSTYIGGATGATSVVGTNGATFYITGVQLEKGSTATSFDYRPYGTELALCQRYCEVNAGFFNAYISYKMGGPVFAVPKRAVPTVTFYSGDNLTGTAGSATEQNATGAAYPITFYVATVSGITGVNITYGTTTNMGFSSISVSEL